MKLNPVMLLFVLSLALLPSAVLHAAEAEVVRVQLDLNAERKQIPDDFIGFGYETSALVREGFFSPKNAPMIQLYRNLSDRGMARIGGIIGDNTRYEPDGKRVAQTQTGTTVINRASLVEFGEFLRATGWKAMWTLNLGTGTKEQAVEQALAVQEALGDRLQSFEIGNEVDLLKRFKSFDEYHAAFLEYKAAVRAALPKAIFSGADVAQKMEWTQRFAELESKDMSLLIHHYYRTGAKKPDATIENLLTPHDTLEVMLSAIQKAAADHGVQFRINEVNSFFGGGKPDVSDTFASSLWCLDFMFRVASHDGAGVNMQTDVNQLGFISHYSPIFRDEAGKLSARPEYYGMLAFAQSGKGKRIPVSAKTDINLATYAVEAADGSIWVTLINKDLKQPANVEIALPADRKTAEGLRLVAPSVQSKTDVMLGGTQVGADGKWTPGKTETIAITGGSAKAKVPATSALLVRVK